MLTSPFSPMAPYTCSFYFSWLSCSCIKTFTKLYQENTTGFFFPLFAPQFLLNCHPQAAHGPCGLWLPMHPGGEGCFTMGTAMAPQVSALGSQGDLKFQHETRASWVWGSDTATLCILQIQLLISIANSWDHLFPCGNICIRAPANLQSTHSPPTFWHLPLPQNSLCIDIFQPAIPCSQGYPGGARRKGCCIPSPN